MSVLKLFIIIFLFPIFIFSLSGAVISLTIPNMVNSNPVLISYQNNFSNYLLQFHNYISTLKYSSSINNLSIYYGIYFLITFICIFIVFFN